MRSIQLAAALAAVFTMTISAHADRDGAFWDPPKRYQKIFVGQLEIAYLPPEEVAIACAYLMQDFKDFPDAEFRGCAKLTERPRKCVVFLIDRPAYGTTPRAVRRHEMGHCNGWPANHPD